MVGDFANERYDETFLGGTTSLLNYMRLLHGLLVSSNEKTESVPGIASKWKASSDGLTWTFTIRKGVKFHNGADLTVDDVAWTLNHMIGPDAAARFDLSLKTITSIKVAGDEVSVTSSVPITYLVSSFLGESSTHTYGIMPKRAKLFDDAAEAAYDKQPVGAGPMKLVTHVTAALMRWERFDDFYYQPANGFSEDRRVPFRTLDLVLAPEEATRIAAIRAGEADMAPVSLPSQKQVEAGGGHLVFGQEGVLFQVFWVACYDPTARCYDKRVRQALDYAINKTELRDKLWGPEVMTVKGWSFVTPSTIGYSSALDPRPFDPAKARQLLADAGYPGGAGFGKVTVNTYPSSALPLMPEAVQVIVDTWKKELGIDAEVKVGDSASLKKAWKSGQINNQIYFRENDVRVDALGSLVEKYTVIEETYRVRDLQLKALFEQAANIVNPDQQTDFIKNTVYPAWKETNYDYGIGYVNIPWAVGPRIVTWKPWPMSAYPSALFTIALK